MTVEKVNSEIVEKMDGVLKTYFSADAVVQEPDAITYPTDFLNSIEVSGLPAHKIELKVGCPIILIRNLNSSHGLTNGTKMIVKELKNNLILAEFALGSKKGDTVFIPRITLIPAETSHISCLFKRRKFPLKRAFAMSTNKAQWQTLNKVGLLLDFPVFSHGQLYVARQC